MRRNITLILLVITVLLVFATAYSVIQKNSAENKAFKLKKEIEVMEKEKETTQELKESEETNTFEDDIEWFVNEIYTLENRTELYEKIEPSATEDVLKGLFGEELPPDENQGEVHSIDRKVDNIQVFGKQQDNEHYNGIVTFDLSFDYDDKSDSAFTVLQVNLKKQGDEWKVSEIEEYAKGSRK